MDNRQASGAAKAATSAMSGTGLMVGLRCWIAILAEGYDAGARGAILSSLATDSKWHLSPLQLGAMGGYIVRDNRILVSGQLLSAQGGDLAAAPPA